MADSMARAPKPTVAPQRDPVAGKKVGPNGSAPAPVVNASLGLLYSAGPALGLAPAVQCKVVVGPPDDPFEQEADRVAERVSAGGPAMRISRLAGHGLARWTQRAPDEEQEPAQTLAVQRQAEDEEQKPAQTLAIQRQADEEEQEPAQTLAVQRQVENQEQEPAQTLAVQRQAAEDEEPAQTLAVQRQASEEEQEPAQTLAIQRQASENEEEPAQTLAVQRRSEEEEPVQPQAQGFGGPAMAAAAGRAIHGRGAGDPLIPTTRRTLERGMGVDLGEVRIHATAGAHGAARALRARAFTHRNHIWLGAGESQADLKLMAHETTHVLQQDGIVRRKPVEEEPAPADQPTAIRPPTPLGAPPALSANGNQPRPQPARDGNDDRQESPEAVGAATTGDIGAPAPGTGEETPFDTAPEPATAEAPATEGQQPAAGGNRSTQPSAGPGGEEEQASQRSPATPEEDPAFQQTLGKIRKTKKAQSKHALPSDKQGEVKAAAVLPEADQETRNARSDHLTTMDSLAQETEKKEESKPSFTPESFKTLLKGNLAELERKLPHSESEAKEFKREKPLEEVKQNIGGQVAAENAKVTGPMASHVKQDPPKSEVKVEPPTDLNEESAGDKPKPISAAAAAPKPMLDSEVSMEAESRSLDDKMAQEGLTEEQLAESNEPTFVEALDTKRQAQQQAADAPGRYREKEEKVLANAQGRARSTGQVGFGAMFAGRTQAFGDVYTKQSGTETSDKSAQKIVLGELERIYNATKTDVEKILGDLSTSVDDLFEREANAAKTTFEKRVEDQLDDIYGITVIDDWIFGEDTAAIEEVFRVEKERFLAAMDLTLDSIAELIARQLNAAIDRIKQGRQETTDFYDGLSTKQQQLADEAIAFYGAQYDSLEDSVNAKQEELAQALAESYKSSADALRESFDKIKDEVSKGWIGKAIDFIVDVATAIKKLGELLLSIVSRLAGLIGDILAHPIRFLENLAAGVAAGFAKFAKNLDTYLLGGFFDWLRGSVGKAGIELPSSFDAKGLFNLATQLLGLTYANLREIAVRKFGENTVAMLETGADLAGEGVALFRVAKQEGLGALWSQISEMITSHVEEIFEKIKETVLYQTIEKVLTFVAGLFTPVGAFIKAIQLLYRGLRFLVDNIDRIADLVNAFLDSLTLAVQGNVGAIADKVVFALRNFIVIAIDFLAKLVGLGNLGDKVRSILKALRKPIERAMEWLLDKLRPLVRAIQGAAKAVTKAVVRKGKAAIHKLLAWWGIRQPFKQGGRAHTLYFRGSHNNAVLVMHSQEEQVVSDWLVARREKASPALRPFVEEALVAFARFNVARGNLETLRSEMEALPAEARTARQSEYEIVQRIFSASLRDLGRTFSALPVEATPARIVLHLPRQKPRALYQQHVRSGRLQHSLQRPQRDTDQLQRWERHARTEMTTEWLDYGRRLGLPDERILRPDWDRRGARVPMQVDHRIEWQVRPLGDESSLDEPWNYEMLDAASNRASGAAIDRAIRGERQRIAKETGDQGWLARDLTFTHVEGGGTSGRRWTLEEIANGAHLEVYAAKYGEPDSRESLPSAEEVAAEQPDEGGAAARAEGIARLESRLRGLERRNPSEASQLRALVMLRLREKSWDEVRTALALSSSQLNKLRDLLTGAGITV